MKGMRREYKGWRVHGVLADILPPDIDQGAVGPC